MDDNLVPLIYVLQALSPQVDRRSGEYIAGAEAGDIWLRNAPKGLEIVKGDTGVLMQPCYFYKDVGEWIPRTDNGGGGFVGRHTQERAKDVPGAKQGHNRKTGEMDENAWTNADGSHDLIDTRNHAVLVYVGGRVLPYLVPLTSTGHSVSRAWMSRINDKIIQEGPAKGKQYPSFAHVYRLTTEQREKGGNRWFVLSPQDERWATSEEYLAGRKLNMQFASGEKRAAAEDASAAPKARGNGPAGNPPAEAAVDAKI
jgi:hypothetical protein